MGMVDFFDKFKSLNGRKRIVSVPVVIQMEATECGAACLAMVLAHYGRWLPLEILRQDCGVSRDGSKASNIVKAARIHGCEAKGYKISCKNIEEVISGEDSSVPGMSLPLIIHWEFNHFVVLEGIKNGRAYINDPAMGHRSVTLEEFSTSYTGICIHIIPGENFQKEGKKYNVIKEVFDSLMKNKGAALFMSLLTLGYLVPSLARPVFSQIFLDDILTKKHPDWMVNLCLAMVISFLISAAITFLRSWILTRWQQKMTLAGSSEFFWHVLRLPMEFFQQRYASEVAGRVSFVGSIASVVSGSASTIILDIIMVIFFLLLLLEYSVPLTIIGVTFSLINLAVFFLLKRKVTDMTMRIQQDTGKAYGAAMNGIQIIESIKANGTEADLFSKIAGYNAKVLNSTQETALMQQKISMVPAFLGGLNGALIMTIGGFSIMEGAMTAGTFMAFQALMGSFTEPFNKVMGLGQSLQTTEMQMQRLDDVRRYKIDSLNFPEKEGEFDGYRLSGKLELRDVSFGYSKLEKPLLENINLTIEPGRWVAVVGLSGSGKSTLGRVVTGLYKEWSGEVLLDDVPREKIPRKVIVNSLSCVDQDVFQMTGTVRENINLFDEGIPKADIIHAAKDACIHDDILRLNGGYDAQINEGGSNFSGGQRQRLEIARALAVNPSILVLDEATSALDPITEYQIITNIRRRGCACLVVAHRLSTIRDCDEIIVLHQGMIVERGRHEDLMAERGYYSYLISVEQAEDGGLRYE